jgi:hypothetical protein
MQFGLLPRRCAALAVLLCAVSPSEQPAAYPLNHAQNIALQYGVEWRLIRAGTAQLKWSPSGQGYRGDLQIESAGLVSKLYRVKDDYRVHLDDALCVNQVFIHAEEGKRRRETTVKYQGGSAAYLERDLIKNSVVLSKELPVPACVYDYIGGLNRLRGYKLEPGQSIQLPMSDGKKFANVKVEAQEREQVKTPLGTYKAMRYEVFMFNDVLVRRKARMYVWLTEDARRLPVQIRIRMQFLVGTITLQLEKEERNEASG